MKHWIHVMALCLLGAALGVPLVLTMRENRELAAQAARWSRQNADLRYELKQATRQAEEVAQRAVALDSQLGSAKIRTTATETRSVQLMRELSEREQREVALLAELAALREKTTATAEPASNPAADKRRITELETQLVQLLTRTLVDSAPEVTSEPKPVTVRYQVVRVGPRDSFVVLDYGSEHGARPNDIIRLRRGTSELAQVQISDARPRFSLAQVLPATLKGQLQTGDLVVFTN